MHIVVFNPFAGKIVSAQVFDTYQTAAGFDNFITQTLPDGFIVIVACKDECMTSLTNQRKQWFANMGSKEIWSLGYRCAFAFIGVAGKQDCHE